MAKIIKMEKVSLKGNPNYTEKVIQEYIFENPSILGLGDLTALHKEKIQPSGGRIDMLMADDSNTRYEIELQLGDTDPSHIIRTIEYWDMERKRYPNYDHCAVIIAEEITGRFLNVISLFNGHIPLIAMQVSALKVSDKEISLVFTKVLDRITLGDEDEEALEPTDRNYWEKKSTPKMLSLVDNLFKEIPGVADEFALKYNKFYIGLARDGIAKNFISFKPKKNFVWMNIKCAQDEAFDAKLEESGLDFNYDKRWRQYMVRVNKMDDYNNNREVINSLIEVAKEKFNV